jgi:hypothetical protein
VARGQGARDDRATGTTAASQHPRGIEVVAMAKRSWSQLSNRQRMFIVVGVAVQVALQALALHDLRHRAVDDVRGPKALWALATFINTLGPVAYFLFGRRRHRDHLLPA